MSDQDRPVHRASAESAGVLGMDISLDRSSNPTTAAATEREVTGRLVTEWVRVRLYGELDLADTDALRVVLSELRYSGYRHVALDLSDFNFLGAAGVGRC